jgi:HK97 family phage portal protein
MALKDFFGLIGRKATPSVLPFVPMFGRQFGFGASNKKYLEEYRNWVFACVQARAEAVSSIQLKLYRNEEVIENNDLYSILNKVNPTMTSQDLFMGTQAFLDLDGNSFWFLARDNEGKGAIREIWLLRPDKVDIVIDKENPLQVAGYTYKQGDGSKIPFGRNEILHFKNFNPLGDYPFPHRGMGVVQAAIWSIETDNEARLWNYSFFKNSARPDGFLTKDGTMTSEEFERLRLQWNDRYQGAEKSHKVAILTGGLKWEDISRSQKEMDFLEQRRFSRDEILALFRTPKSVVGIVEDVNRANAEASNYIFASRTVDPLMQKIVSTLNEFLVPEFGEDLYLDYADPVPEDRQMTINWYVSGIDKWLTRNEIREMEGLPPSANGDSFFGQFTTAPIDTVPEEPKKSAKPARKSKKKKSDTQKLVEQFVGKLPVAKEEVRQLSETAKNNYVEMWNKSFDVEVGPFQKQINAFLEKQQEEVIANIIAETKGLGVKEYKYKALSDFMYDEDEAVSTMIDFTTPNLRRYLTNAGEQAILLTGVGTAFDPTNPASVKFIKERAKFFSETFNQTTAEALLKELGAGVEANESTAELSERIARFYDGVASFRSERAARTEVSASSNFGAKEAYMQAGVEKMQWLVVQPCPICETNAGEVRTIGDGFPSGDEQPPVHPNCVCALLPYFG